MLSTGGVFKGIDPPVARQGVNYAVIHINGANTRRDVPEFNLHANPPLTVSSHQSLEYAKCRLASFYRCTVPRDREKEADQNGQCRLVGPSRILQVRFARGATGFSPKSTFSQNYVYYFARQLAAPGKA